MASPAYNMKNPAVKRILQEIKEVQADTSGDFMAEALESDIFEWHFTIRGPPDTEFEGGIYHGRILLPAEYPFKPPAFMMLTPSGRFETGVKICLSISAHHPEHWQPSWSVRTALTALVAFMPSPGAGALGSLDYTKDERRKLALKSRQDSPRWGSADRQRLIDEMHTRMLTITQPSKASTSQDLQSPVQPPSSHPQDPTTPPATANDSTAQQPQSPTSSTPAPAPFQPASPQQPPSPSTTLQPPTNSTPLTPSPAASPSAPSTPEVPHTPVQPTVTATTAPAAELRARLTTTRPAPPATPTTHTPISRHLLHTHTTPVVAAPPPPDTWGLTVLAVALGVMIVAILLRKALAAAGYQMVPLTSSSRMFSEDR